jgi:hypothetical protein
MHADVLNIENILSDEPKELITSLSLSASTASVAGDDDEANLRRKRGDMKKLESPTGFGGVIGACEGEFEEVWGIDWV